MLGLVNAARGRYIVTVRSNQPPPPRRYGCLATFQMSDCLTGVNVSNDSEEPGHEMSLGCDLDGLALLQRRVTACLVACTNYCIMADLQVDQVSRLRNS